MAVSSQAVDDVGVDRRLDRLLVGLFPVVLWPQLVHQPLPATRRPELEPASPAAGEIGTPLRSSIPTSWSLRLETARAASDVTTRLRMSSARPCSIVCMPRWVDVCMTE